VNELLIFRLGNIVFILEASRDYPGRAEWRHICSARSAERAETDEPIFRSYSAIFQVQVAKKGRSDSTDSSTVRPKRTRRD